MGRSKFVILCLPVLFTVAFLIATTGPSADTLCEDEPVVIEEVETCAATYPEAETLKASSGSMVLVGKSFEVTCTSALTAKTEKDLGVGKGLEGQLTELTFSGCKSSCSSATAANTPYKAILTATGEGNASLALSPKSGSPTMKMTGCTEAKVSCEYSAEKVTLDLTGGEPALIKAVSEPLKRTGGSEACPLEATLSGTYEVTQPTESIYAAPGNRPQTLLCKVNTNENCAAGNKYMTFTTIKTVVEGAAIVKYKYANADKDTQCTTSPFDYTHEERGAPMNGKTLEVHFSNCTPCPLYPEQKPYRLESEAKPMGSVDGNGTLVLRGLIAGPPRFRIDCGTPHECYYEPGAGQFDQLAATFKGGAPAKIEFVNHPLVKVAGGSDCSTTATFNATYKVTTPNPATSALYLTR